MSLQKLVQRQEYGYWTYALLSDFQVLLLNLHVKKSHDETVMKNLDQEYIPLGSRHDSVSLNKRMLHIFDSNKIMDYAMHYSFCCCDQMAQMVLQMP